MQLSNFRISTRLIMGFGALVGMVALVSLLGMSVARSTSQSINTIYNNRLVPIALLKQVNDNYVSVVLDASNKVSLDLLEPAKAVSQVNEGRIKAAEAWKVYSETATSDDEKIMVAEVNNLIAKATPTIQEFSAALAKNDMYKISLLIRDLDEKIVPIGRASCQSCGNQPPVHSGV